MSGFIIFFGVIGIIVSLFALVIISIYAGSLFFVAINSFKETVKTLTNVQIEHIHAKGEQKREKLKNKRIQAEDKKQLKLSKKQDILNQKRALAERKAALKGKPIAYQVPSKTADLATYTLPEKPRKIESVQRVTLGDKQYTIDEIATLYSELEAKAAKDKSYLKDQIDKARAEVEEANKAKIEADKASEAALAEAKRAKDEIQSLKDLMLAPVASDSNLKNMSSLKEEVALGPSISSDDEDAIDEILDGLEDND